MLRNIVRNGLKFIPVPKKLLKHDDIAGTTEQIIPDISLKVVFAEDDMDNNNIEQLRTNSEWTFEDIPPDIRQHISNFVIEVQQHFKPRTGISNISKHQATVLDSIRKNKNVIICHADKNLGPVAIDTEQYIRLALNEHLPDTTI